MKTAQLLVLGLAVVAGGAAAFLVQTQEEPKPVPQPAANTLETTEVLVARGPIGVGETLSAQSVQWQLWPAASAGQDFIRKRAGAVEELAGAIARAQFSAGEPIREDKLIKGKGAGYLAAILPDGMRAITIDIKPDTSVGGFVLPNDRVDLILTRAQRSGVEEFYVSETILKNIRVLAIDQTAQEKSGQRTVVGNTATLEVSPDQAEQVAVARRLGSLSLSLRSLRNVADDSTNGRDLNRRETINIVRFGNSTNVMK